jgi:hypothetical protein
MPAIEKGYEIDFQTHKLGLLLTTVTDLGETPLLADRSALSGTADPFAREAPAQPGDLLVQVALPQGQWALLNVAAANFRHSWQRFALRVGIWFLGSCRWQTGRADRRLLPCRGAARYGTEVSPLPERGAARASCGDAGVQSDAGTAQTVPGRPDADARSPSPTIFGRRSQGCGCAPSSSRTRTDAPRLALVLIPERDDSRHARLCPR